MTAFCDPPDLGSAFARLAAAQPDAPALRYGDEDVSYGALERYANGCAHWLAAAGIGRGSVVLLCHDKAAVGYATMLACLKLGAAYVHLDPESPAARLDAILAVAEPQLLAIAGEAAPGPREAAAGRGVAVWDLGAATEAAQPPAAPRPQSADVAYLMFTSGSTGTPKGVAVSHGNLRAFLPWVQERFGVGRSRVVTGLNPVYFDNAVFDFYATLFGGACLAPFPRDLLRDPGALVEAVAARRCSQWFSVPSLLIYLVRLRALDGARLPDLAQIAFGGEGYPKAELARLTRAVGPHKRLLNVYGPTETTCICSAYEVTEADLADTAGLPPIGELAEPVDGYLLDGDRPVEAGEIGELCLAGPMVAAGYYNDRARTAQAFPESPVHPQLPTRLYRTGDLMRRDAGDGLLYFVGRTDNQIKHLGYRIAPEEIEAALVRLAGVRQACVVHARPDSGPGHLVACLALDPETDRDGPALARSLAGLLPSYMIPQIWRFYTELPKNANGKVDRPGLKAEAEAAV